MKNTFFGFKRAALLIALLTLFTGASAQALRTGYFTDGYMYRYRLNPAFSSTRGHVAIPVVSNMNLESMGNIGLSNFIFHSPTDKDKLLTFMHPDVNTDDFVNGLMDNNIMSGNIDLSILSTAFHAWGGFNSIDITFRSSTGVSLPRDLFRFMKVMGNGEYNISEMNFHTRNFADISLGHSRKVNESLTLGGRVKVLLGLAYADASFSDMHLSASDQRWEVMARGSVDVALGGHFTKENGGDLVTGYKGASLGLHGIGAGVDLGAAYAFNKGVLKGLTLSAAVNDLGFISWKKSAHSEINPDAPYVFEGFGDMSVDGESNNTIDDQFDDIANDLEDFFVLKERGVRNITEGLGAKVNAGVEYEMPFYRRLSVGLLYSGCFDKAYTYNQGSLVVNCSPLDFLDIAVSGRVNSYGSGFGLMLNLHVTGYAFFIGTDCFMNKVNKQFIPINNLNSHFSFGMCFSLGKAKSKKVVKAEVKKGGEPVAQ